MDETQVPPVAPEPMAPEMPEEVAPEAPAAEEEAA